MAITESSFPPLSCTGPEPDTLTTSARQPQKEPRNG